MMPDSEVTALSKRQGLISDSTSSESLFDTSRLQEMLLKSIADARELMDENGKIGSYYTRSGDGPDDWYVGTIPPKSVTVRNAEVVLSGGVNNAITVAVQDTDDGTGRQWFLCVKNGAPIIALQTVINDGQEYHDGGWLGDVDENPATSVLPSAMLLAYETVATLLSVKRSQLTDQERIEVRNSQDAVQAYGPDGLDENGRDRNGCLRRVKLGKGDGFDGNFQANYFLSNPGCRPLPASPLPVSLPGGWHYQGNRHFFNIPCVVIGIPFTPYKIPYTSRVIIDTSDCCEQHNRALYCAETDAQIDSADIQFVTCVWDKLWRVVTQGSVLCRPIWSIATDPEGAGVFWAQFKGAFTAAYLSALLGIRGEVSKCATSRGFNKRSCLCGGKEPTVRLVNGKWEIMDCPGKKCANCRLSCVYDEQDIYAVGWRHVNNEPWKPCCPGTDKTSLEKAAGTLKKHCPDRCTTCKWVCNQFIEKHGKRIAPLPEADWVLVKGHKQNWPCCDGEPPKPPKEGCPTLPQFPIRQPNDTGAQ